MGMWESMESVIDEEEVAGLGPVAKMLTSHTSALAHDLWCLWNLKAYANHLTTPLFFSQIKKKWRKPRLLTFKIAQRSHGRGGMSKIPQNLNLSD